MGVAIKDILTIKEIEIEDLKGRKLAIDSYNMLYQFLTTIRSRDGSLLTDSKGNVTSHLVGLFSRTTKLMDYGLKPIFVFDGKPPKIKEQERERRKELKIEAEKKYAIAVEKKDTEDMKKYASMSTRLTRDMIDDAKTLISSLGLPIVQAPSEGEAQAAYMAKKGDAFAVVSQDFDSLLHQSPNLVRNLSIAGKRKKASTLSYTTVKPELINLADNLNNLGITHDQLIIIAILTGTDYNYGGVKGIGPKTAIKLVKEHKSDFDALFKHVKWEYDLSWKEIFGTIRDMPVTDEYDIHFRHPDVESLKSFLVDKHDFSEERIDSSMKGLVHHKEDKKQKGLGDFFG